MSLAYCEEFYCEGFYVELGGSIGTFAGSLGLDGTVNGYRRSSAAFGSEKRLDASFFGYRQSVGLFDPAVQMDAEFIGDHESSGLFFSAVELESQFIGYRQSLGVFELALSLGGEFVGADPSVDAPGQGVFIASLAINSGFAGYRQSLGLFDFAVHLDSEVIGYRSSDGVFEPNLQVSSTFIGQAPVVGAPGQGVFVSGLVLDTEFDGYRVSYSGFECEISLDCEWSGYRESEADFDSVLGIDGTFVGESPDIAVPSGIFSASIAFNADVETWRGSSAIFDAAIPIAVEFVASRSSVGLFELPLGLNGTFGGPPPVYPDWDGCPSISAMGIDGFPFSGESYPFLVPTIASQFIGDLHISTTERRASELRLVWVAGVGEAPTLFSGIPPPVHEIDMLFSTDNGDLVFDTREMSFDLRVWCGNTVVVTYTLPGTLIQVVIERDPESISSFVADAMIDRRATAIQSVGVSRFLAWVDGEYRDVTHDFAGARLTAGFNYELSARHEVSSRGERINEITFNSASGSGLGMLPACDLNIGLAKIANAEPTVSGDLLISGDSCLTIEPELNFEDGLAEIVPGRFLISDQCTAKCTCEDFVSVANYAVATWNRYRQLADRVKTLQGKYHELRDFIAAWQTCARDNPIRVHTWPAGDCEFGVGIGVCNITDGCLTDLGFLLRIEDSDGNLVDASPMANYVYQVDYLGGVGYTVPAGFTESGGEFVFQLADVEPGQMGFVFARIHLEDCAQVGNVRATLTGTFPTGGQTVVTRPYRSLNGGS